MTKTAHQIIDEVNIQYVTAEKYYLVLNKEGTAEGIITCQVHEYSSSFFYVIPFCNFTNGSVLRQESDELPNLIEQLHKIEKQIYEFESMKELIKFAVTRMEYV